MQIWKVIFLAVGLGALVGVCYVLKFVADADSVFSTERRDVLAEWPTFYKDRMSKLIDLPSDASPVSAVEFSSMFDTWYEVEFLLPDAKAPETWLAEIAERSQLAPYKRDKHRYDAGWDSKAAVGLPPKMDFCEVTYHPDTQTYRAFWGTG